MRQKVSIIVVKALSFRPVKAAQENAKINVMGIPFVKLATVGLLPSCLKTLYYRSKGAKIGKNVSIGIFSTIDARTIELGDNTKIGPLSFVKATKFCVGKRVEIKSMVAVETGDVVIDDDTVIMEQVIIGGTITPRSSIKIGKRVKVFPHSFLNPTEEINIEDDVGVGGLNHIFTHGSWKSVLEGYPIGFGPVTIKKGTWLQWRVFITPNVTIGEDSIIGANTVITKSIAPNSTVYAAPHKVISDSNKYFKEPSADEKNRLLLRIVREFHEYMSYLGHETSFQDSDNDSTFSISSGKGNGVLCYRKDLKDLPSCNILISLSRINEDLIDQCKKRNIIWFDIASKQCCFSNDPLWGEVRNFLSRYGIRFEILSS